MHILTEDSAADFLRRFSSLDDAVIRRVEIGYPPSKFRRVVLTISSQDAEVESGWSNLLLKIQDVKEISFREGNTTCQVMSAGLTIRWYGEDVWCDLSSYSSEVHSIQDFRNSDFYIAGRTVEWQTEPYSTI